MAINFSASFAACIAAGLKVPRQIMYCITQDTGQPYVLYKDSQEAERNAAAIGGTPTQWGTEMYPGIQQQHLSAQQQNAITANGQAAASNGPTSHSPNGDHHARENGGDGGGVAGAGGGVRQQGSPSTSPYPPQQQQRTNGTNEDDVNMNQVNGLQQSNSNPNANPNQSSNDPQQQHQQQQQQNGNGGPPSSDNNPAGNNPQHVQQQQNGQANDHANGFPGSQNGELSSYYAPRHPAAQGGLMAPPGFPPLHYLNKPMLPGLNGSMDQGSANGPANGLEAYALPELLPGQNGAANGNNQQNGGAGHNASTANGAGGGRHGSGGNSSGNHKPPKPHSDLRLFKCLTCGKDFKQKSTLLQHDRIHTDARPYPCSECGKRFRQQSHLTQHLRIHANEKPFTCGYCNRGFRQRAILNQHVRIHSGEKPFACPECGKHFRQKAILNQHVRTHQDVSPHLIFKNGPHPTLWPQDVPYPGDETDTKNGIAGDGYNDEDSQNGQDGGIHYPAYFKDGKGNFYVQQLGFDVIFGVFFFRAGQKILPDVLSHIGIRPANMPLYVRCPICDKEFKQKTTLLQHGCIHIESRPYPCPECGKRFRQQSHLTQHLRIHTNEKPFGCLYCPRFFRQRTILNQHVRIHTGEKPYKCGQCGKDFRQKAILDQHTRTHQGDRPFCCPMPNCRRRFATENEVTKHIDNHMNPTTKRSRQANNTANNNNSNNNNNNNNSHAAAAAASVAAAAAANHLINETKNAAAAQQFLNNNNPAGDNKNNILPRGMGAPNPGSQVKNELYFPQCYGPPFQHPFQTQQPTAAHANGQPAVTVSVANSVAPGVVGQQNAPTSVVVAQ
ncbi:zinc finger protein 316 isoform X2 [Stomoxys calcitrans]|uniref:zinc finger protein 316 isoform X2 n=1 Tax=Stomoxys calcitrans TaxID=35570 RepID=UPI0027E2A142|nr:zinc finger protein 316 isoform X2 [Stomoxys calcitrans]